MNGPLKLPTQVVVNFILLIIVAATVLAGLVMYLRPPAAKAVVTPIDAPECRLFGDWTSSNGRQWFALYTFKADGTYEVHGDINAPPIAMGDWALENGKLRIWPRVNMRKMRGAYDEAPMAWTDDSHFKAGSTEFALLRKVKSGNCKK